MTPSPEPLPLLHHPHRFDQPPTSPDQKPLIIKYNHEPEHHPSNATSNAPPIFSFTSLLSPLFSFIASTFNKNQDILKLLFVGGSIGTVRYLCSTLWQRFIDSFFLTAHIHHPDEAYSWMMIWLAQQNGLFALFQLCKPLIDSLLKAKTQEVQVCTGNWGLTYHKDVTILLGPSLSRSADSNLHLHKTRLLSYLPAFGVKQWVKYRGTWMSVYRTKEVGLTQGGNRNFQYETLVVSLLTRDWCVLQQLLQEARDRYKSKEENLVCVHGINKDNFSWMRLSEKSKRPLSTVILPTELKTALLNDLKAFLSSETWYTEKGIPYRRGYLLHGVPGSGKSSLIHSIAGEFDLHVYIISLSIMGLDDTTLCKVIGLVPARSIIVFEDLDVLLPHRDNDKETSLRLKPGSLTLSGLLNALDGLSAQEGRIIFATSNKYYTLDAALRRPGRLDRHFEFHNASKQQAKQLFFNFYDGPTTSTTLSIVQGIGEKSEEIVDDAELEALSIAFSERIPEKRFSMASLQEYLVQYKYQPRTAVSALDEWVEREMKQ